MAVNLLRSTDDLQEIMLYVPGVQDIDPDTVLDDIKLIRDIVVKCDLKTQYVQAPKTEEEAAVVVCSSLPSWFAYSLA